LPARRKATSVILNPRLYFPDTNALFVRLNSTNVVVPGPALQRKYDVVVYLYGQKMY
jgi:hypothetical protein